MPSKFSVVLAVFVLLAGCSDTGFLGRKTTDIVSEKKPEEPKLVGSSATGGNCAKSPAHHVEVETKNEDGRRYIAVSGNVSVPDASYVLDAPNLTETGWGNYTLRVSSRRTAKKPERGCAALANYTATVRVPDGGPHESFALTVVHDGEVVRRVNVTSR
ncbi:hypothetical protein [Haladaptatus salinisoli]|uniref:hypothetical protein n=1 Tax=Haladaptatus salinisoli TaxID=2884876 RepID=UPI001D0B18A7|nr:hypothetical protein [Haladaptatus salinisoli]